jgi:hypothetical protein
VKVVHIDTGAEMRGGQRQALLLLSALHSAGCEVVLLARRDSQLFLAAKNAPFPVYCTSLYSVFKYSSAADIVHAHDARAHLLACLAARCPFVVSRRVAFPVKQSFTSRWKYARAARYLAVSEYVGRELQRGGVEQQKIDVVYDAVAETAHGTYDPAAPAVGLASADPQKGSDLLSEAVSLTGIPFKFSENLPRDLQRACMFVYITRSEGLGSAALLAMSMGIPVIASKVGGLAEVFEDGISGLYTTNEPDRISATMQQLRQSPALAEELIANAKLRVQQKFSVESMLRGTLASYRRALDA